MRDESKANLMKKISEALDEECEQEKYEQLSRIIYVLCNTEGGIFKRLDNHRELRALMQEKVPEFLDNYPWVNGWIEAQDRFLEVLIEESGIVNSMNIEVRGKAESPEYPNAKQDGSKDNEQEEMIILGKTGAGRSALSAELIKSIIDNAKIRIIIEDGRA